ncbi:hypothetical protein [Paenibacillus xerothermodurans]|uniref:Uncharacterized protein n=1 Tax=Paenibacillus xerothermodurans TaxID=1977292 RepID=A0A2W1NTJ4_PAEXE|nr:hypothetical protein [Paenibacillus xerothermodurans]PZE21066.1 hypothetical protein CBW46_010330 [Paenibacillus xerothermodurans]
MKNRTELTTSHNVAKRTGMKYKKVALTTRQARATQNLGNGFSRVVFDVTVPGNTYADFSFRHAQNKVIDCGWWIDRNLSQPAYPVSNYPLTNHEWIIVLRNLASNARNAQLHFLVKR